MASLPRRLYRKRDGRMVAGVAAGLADYFDVDPTLVRLVFVITALINGIGLLAYIVMIFIVPEESRMVSEGTPTKEESSVMTDQPPTESTRASEPPPSAPASEDWRSREQRHTWAGIILVALGLLFLAQNVGMLWWWNWKIFWPVVLIGVGAMLLSRRPHRT